MTIENACLRKEIKESKEAFDKTLASKEEKFQSTLDSKDKDIEYYNSEIIIQRKSRSVLISHLSQVMTSSLNKSCHCCGKSFRSNPEIKDHNESFRGYCFTCKICFKTVPEGMFGWNLYDHEKCPGAGFISCL